MTRKAHRKRLQQQAKLALRRTNPGPGWMRLGAFVASAALGAAPAAAALPDARFALVDAAFRHSSSPLPRPFAAAYAATQAQAATPQDPPARRFDIPAGPLADAVPVFERLAGVHLTLALPSIGSVQSPGVSGTFTTAQALNELLKGTGVRARFTATGTAVLELSTQSESVDVVGRVGDTTLASPKYPETIRDTPQTIEVIPRAAMEAQGVTTLSEALRNVPGITLQAGEGGGASSTAGDMFNMRGFNASNSLFVDNVRDDGLVSRDVFNLEQVEVFMGPTGSDVGRGTAAGYVNMQTKTPHLPAAAARRRSPSAPPTSAAPRSTSISRSRSEQRQLAGSRRVRAERAVAGQRRRRPRRGRERDQGLRAVDRRSASARRRASSRRAQILRQDNLPDYGIPGAAWHDEPLAPTTVQAPRPVDQSNYYGSPAYDYDHAVQNTRHGARRARPDAARWTLRNQTRYNQHRARSGHQHDRQRRGVRPGDRAGDGARQGNDAREHDHLEPDQPRRVASRPERCEHNISSGLEFTREAQFAPTLAGVGTRAPVDIYNPESERSGHRLRRRADRRVHRRPDRHRRALRLRLRRRSDRGVQVNGGLRFEHYDTDVPRRRRRRRDDDRTSAAPTSSSAARPACVFASTERQSSTCRTARP